MRKCNCSCAWEVQHNRRIVDCVWTIHGVVGKKQGNEDDTSRTIPRPPRNPNQIHWGCSNYIFWRQQQQPWNMISTTYQIGLKFHRNWEQCMLLQIIMAYYWKCCLLILRDSIDRESYYLIKKNKKLILNHSYKNMIENQKTLKCEFKVHNQKGNIECLCNNNYQKQNKI